MAVGSCSWARPARGGGGERKCIFFAFFLHLKEAVCFCVFFLHIFGILLHLSCLQFPFIVAIHGQVCVTCTIWTGGGMQMHLHFFFASHFLQSQLAPPPLPSMFSLDQFTCRSTLPMIFALQMSGGHSREMVSPSNTLTSERPSAEREEPTAMNGNGEVRRENKNVLYPVLCGTDAHNRCPPPVLLFSSPFPLCLGTSVTLDPVEEVLPLHFSAAHAVPLALVRE